MRVWFSTLVVGLAACGLEGMEQQPAPDRVGVNPAEVARVGPSVPIYGGTMAGDDDHLVAVDPSRGMVAVWDAAGDVRALSTVDDAQPFRVAMAGDRFLVTLRATGQVAAFDLDASLLGDVYVCAEPRGIEVVGEQALVACASGELVELDIATLDVQRSQLIDTDLRDVEFDGTSVWVSRFRAAEVLELNAESWEVMSRTIPSTTGLRGLEDTVPHVAWRMRLHPDGGVVLLHQLSSQGTIDIEAEPITGVDEENDEPESRVDRYYGIPMPPPPVETRGCVTGLGNPDMYPVVTSHLTHISDAGSATTPVPIPNMVLPTDFAILGDTTVLAGSGLGRWGSGLFKLSEDDGVPCTERLGGTDDGFVGSVAVAGGRLAGFARNSGVMVGQSRDWERIYGPREVHAESVALFHENPQGGISCANCHPEGTQDGHTYNFEPLGPRRTQDLTGGLLARAPFHWDGEFAHAEDLIARVMTGGMNAGALTQEETTGLFAWLNDVASVRTTTEAAMSEIALGEEVFHRADVGCVSCHTGEQGSDHQLHAVRESPTKTPSLKGVASRAPFMHDGCAATLRDRFTDEACGGGDNHGVTSHLNDDEIDALVAYLTTL